ncbi:MAG: hypothetical protein IKR07_00810 [Oscillospiraceae bacterium]|nr:hypothetical protein [Oscillospiraceae bacterium]
MNPRLEAVLSAMKRYNCGVMSTECLGFDPDVTYDALVLAPGWKPTKTVLDPAVRVTQLTQHAYFSGFLLEKGGLKVAWAQTASGACNLIDHGVICGELRFNKLIFGGAVGGLVEGFEVGDLCTPELCISGVYSDHYLDERLTPFTPFSEIRPPEASVEKAVSTAAGLGYVMKRARVFCTDSIALEYSHLDEIRATGAQLIEMETGTFFKLASLFEVPAAALLLVSDNSATGAPLLGRGDDPDSRYKRVRGWAIPDLIFALAGDKSFSA